ncbi:NADH dehydrogenase subunit 2 (mitochondrion) [Anolis carolinensis]|uniref:NADH-ubiquinone oxidoreductase chain 2 n=2 Tax=Anolis carolinensis TaxID=28377 RepID=B3GSZ1_ANOCA|nr:NADH dehydrogenase subunit 2 [Anolis carolinensis]AFI39251.1 NADH dehydrogenase subunit 2 [Anolis carolinensis]AFI39266.1 NADH dehydrogenase subunit 2 [Anolis carolinensis]AFI39305.1 NADH dehydrogenase subunit 2 [Anolis carolinensis]AFI39357.1 NADH dehydrogenase subunit 2 [Anolis carolinensis]|eukprot:YP_001974671.2 NADH dehydrogenase subunit 2 (mitochondrion) [Anolis carolinensis]
MSPTIYMIILSTLATGTIITMTSYHWLMAWVGLELNTLAIIPIISTMHHPRSTEAATKYFLTQAAASALILFSSMTNAWNTGSWDITQPLTSPSHILLTMALAMKLGLAPLHFWLPEVIQGSTMTTAFIITTWQKIAPMSLIFLTMNNLSTSVFLLMGLLSSLVGGWGGLNQTQTRKIMAYSSIAHLGWMATISSIMTNILIMNLLIYLIMTTSVFLSLIISKSKTIQDTTSTWTLSPTLTIIMLLSLLSLGGLPPLTGFIPKWLIMEELILQNFNLLISMMAMSSLLSLYFYLRLTYTTALTLSPNTTQTKFKWRFYPNTSTMFIITPATISIFLLPMTPLILL